MCINYILADFISRINIASKAHFVSITVRYNKICLQVLKLFLKNGIIRGFSFYGNDLIVYLKYFNNKPIFRNLIIISKPSKRVFWTLSTLRLNFSSKSFAGFYVISTSRGLLTSNECLLSSFVSGEVLLKVEI